MVERYTIVDNRPLTFEGYFKPTEVFQVIRRFLKERGYFPLEKKNFEEVYEHGKQVMVELRPFKEISDYMKQEMILVIKMTRLKEETVEIDGMKQRFQHGSVTILFTANIVSDMKSKWEGAGWLYLLRTLNDKFIRKDWISKAKAQVKKDCNDLVEEVMAYLNMIKFKVQS